MYTFKKNYQILNKYKIIDTIRRDGFAEYYRVEDIGTAETYGLVYFSIEKGSRFENQFDAFVEYTKNFLDFESPGFLKPLKLYHNLDSSLNRLYCIWIFNPSNIKTTLAELISWDEMQYTAEKQDAETIKKIILDVISSLSEIHQQGKYHGFISPDTIFMEGSKYLISFPGIAWLTAEIKDNDYYSITAPNIDINVFPLAPEGILDLNNLSPFSDIWSLGVLLSILSSGKLPFHFHTEKEYLLQLKNNRFTLNLDEIPQYFQNLVSKCLQISANDRISLEDLQNEIESLEVSWVCPKCGHTNEPFESRCENCSAQRISHQSIQKSALSNWYNLSTNRESRILENNENRFQIYLRIEPTKLPARKDVLNTGKSFNLLVRDKSSADESGKKRLRLEILPKPIFKFPPEKFQLFKKGDRTSFEGSIIFQLLRSKVIIENIFLEIDGSSEIVEDIYFAQLNESINSGNFEYEIKFNVNKELQIDKPVPFKLELKLKGRNPEVIEGIFIARFPADLTMVSDLNHMFSVFVGQKNRFNLRLKNQGGCDAIIKEIVIQENYPFVKIAQTLQNELSSQAEMDIPIEIDGSNMGTGVIHGKITIKYMDRFVSGLSPLKIKEFNFSVQFVDLTYADTLAIDFGTTNTCVAFRDSTGQSSHIELSNLNEWEYDRTSIPSIIYYPDSDRVIIGRDAKQAFIIHQSNVFHSIKRYIGQNRLINLIYPPDKSKTLNYEEMVYHFLKELINDVTNMVGKKFTKFIFTFPTKAGQKWKISYLNIIEALGIEKEKVKLLDEASAGALNYARMKNKENWILVYDFGGGTTDIAYTHYYPDKSENNPFGDIEWCFKTIAALGNPNLGGDNITLAAIEIIREEIFNKYQFITPYISPQDNIPFTMSSNMQKKIGTNTVVLWNIAERFKIDIKSNEFLLKSEWEGLVVTRGGKLRDPLTWNLNNVEILPRSEIENLDWKSIRLRLFQYLQQPLENSIQSSLNVIRKDAEEGKPITILLLGKSSQFPLVRALFEYYLRPESYSFDAEYYGFEPTIYDFPNDHNCTIDMPDDLKIAVVKGAIDSLFDGIRVIQDTLVADIGIRNSAGTDFIPLIKAGTKKINKTQNPKNILSFIKNSDIDDYAIYLSKPFTLNGVIERDFYRRSGLESIGELIGTIQISIHSKFRNQQGFFLLYVASDDNVGFIVLNEEEEIIEAGKI